MRQSRGINQVKLTRCPENVMLVVFNRSPLPFCVTNLLFLIFWQKAKMKINFWKCWFTGIFLPTSRRFFRLKFHERFVFLLRLKIRSVKSKVDLCLCFASGSFRVDWNMQFVIVSGDNWSECVRIGTMKNSTDLQMGNFYFDHLRIRLFSFFYTLFERASVHPTRRGLIHFISIWCVYFPHLIVGLWRRNRLNAFKRFKKQIKRTNRSSRISDGPEKELKWPTHLMPSKPSSEPFIVSTGARAYAFATRRFRSKTITLAHISSSICVHLSKTSWMCSWK